MLRRNELRTTLAFKGIFRDPVSCSIVYWFATSYKVPEDIFDTVVKAFQKRVAFQNQYLRIVRRLLVIDNDVPSSAILNGGATFLRRRRS
jgi:hypothetical protein